MIIMMIIIVIIMIIAKMIMIIVIILGPLCGLRARQFPFALQEPLGLNPLYPPPLIHLQNLPYLQYLSTSTYSLTLSTILTIFIHISLFTYNIYHTDNIYPPPLIQLQYPPLYLFCCSEQFTSYMVIFGNLTINFLIRITC